MLPDGTPSLQHRSAAGWLRSVRGGCGHYWLVASGQPGQVAEAAAAAVYGWVADTVRTRGLAIVHERLFGSLSVADQVVAARAAAFQTRGEAAPSPMTYLEGAPAWGAGFAGAIVHCVARDSIESGPWVITDEGTPCGRGWRSDGSVFVTLQGLDGGARPAAQGSDAVVGAISQARRLLQQQGCDYAAVVRTWFYLDRVLDWYDEFNRARDGAYGTVRFEGAPGGGEPGFPASTGVGGRSACTGACTLDVLAARADRGRSPRARFLGSPMQNAPASYGSAFSRAAALDLDRGSLIQISGTAAIDGQGRSLFPGDAEAQINHTLDVVASLLAEHGGRLDDICAATAFIKQAEDAPTLLRVLTARGLEALPVVVVQSDICRKELLFELDGEALIASSSCPGQV